MNALPQLYGEREHIGTGFDAERGNAGGPCLYIEKSKREKHRLVPIPGRLARELKKCETYSNDHYLRKPEWATTKESTPLRVWMRDIWTNSGLDVGTQIHWLRHTWATEMAERGEVMPFELMERGGWAKLSQVEIYFHKRGRVTRAGVDRPGKE